MCYLVTLECSGTVESSEQFSTLEQSRKHAEQLALDNPKDTVTVWLRTHTVGVRPQAFWQEHAKGLSGNGN